MDPGHSTEGGLLGEARLGCTGPDARATREATPPAPYGSKAGGPVRAHHSPTPTVTPKGTAQLVITPPQPRSSLKLLQRPRLFHLSNILFVFTPPTPPTLQKLKPTVFTKNVQRSRRSQGVSPRCCRYSLPCSRCAFFVCCRLHCPRISMHARSVTFYLRSRMRCSPRFTPRHCSITSSSSSLHWHVALPRRPVHFPSATPAVAIPSSLPALAHIPRSVSPAPARALTPQLRHRRCFRLRRLRVHCRLQAPGRHHQPLAHVSIPPRFTPFLSHDACS